ncbi:MAG: DEAD/DEAH box helicase [Candidatus Onthovivens sp.]|nr:DEAD/DEAH box helicase [Candidatus Onthovivens sp.]
MNNNQLEAFNKFKKLKVGALFMKMGTGKTKVAIELIDYNKCDLLVYVAPFSTLKNIENEFIKWNLKTPYKLIGYETISSSDRQYLELLNQLKNKKVFIVADESIFIKNEETKRFKRLLEIRKHCEYALILNGTPLTKNEWDLYNQMEFLSPLILKMNREQFLNTFFKKITYRKKGHKENTFYKFSEVNAELLYKMVEPYIFKCELDFYKDEISDYHYVIYENDDYYIEKEKRLNEYIEKGTSNVIINMLTSLNVIASNYDKKNDEVIKYIKDKQVIVFCNYLDEIDYISSKLDCYVIIGNIKNRNEIIKKFKNDNKPLLMTYGVGSYSLNLQFCNEIVYSSINFDYAKLEQSKYRIKRIGQEQDIKYTYFLTNLGITKLILENLDKKMTLENLVKEKMMEGDLKWLKSI